ncbi:adenylyl-sulfate kinase [Streptomyces sp. NPDC057877]|uniref:adenylyl-sulfate kinase n=1 Tax=Streptomyces sp. NPDC057877 TaxID=3346269 RepID=UPI00367DEC52
MTARSDRGGVRCRCTCPGATVWVTGDCAADRLAAAYALAERLHAERRRVEVLDRFDDLGTDARRVGLIAEVLARNGVVAVVPCAPRTMAAVRARHAASDTRYLEVCVDGRRSPQESALAVHGRLAGRH